MSAKPDQQPIDSIRAAQAALEAEARRLRAIGDPQAETIGAFALGLIAMHQTLSEAAASSESQQKLAERVVQQERRPWAPTELRILADQLGPVIDDMLLHRWVRFNRWGIAGGVGVALVLAALVGAGGWWLHGAAPEILGMRAGPEQCTDQADGSRLCWQGVYTRLPRSGS